MGLPVEVARTAAAAGSGAQLVGRVGDDPTGDAALLDLAAAGVGHVALLRTPGARTPVEPLPESPTPSAVDEPAADLTTGLEADDERSPRQAPSREVGLAIDADDLDLALRYLPDYRVLVIATDLDDPAWRVVADAAGWSGAAIVALVPPDAQQTTIPDAATVLERPGGTNDTDAEAAFAGVVGRYAAGLDGGSDPREAFAAATAAQGWAPVEG